MRLLDRVSRRGAGSTSGRHAPAERPCGGGCLHAGAAGQGARGRGSAVVDKLGVGWIGYWRGGSLMLRAFWSHVSVGVLAVLGVCVWKGVWVMGDFSLCRYFDSLL